MMTRKWTKQDEGFLREHYSNNRTEDLARVLRRSKSAVETHAKRLGIRKSRKFLETYCRFKYKNIPGNSIPEGKESTKGGYIMIKPDGERRLVFKHIWVWEQHNGKRPEGVIITFRDGDKTNCDISDKSTVYLFSYVPLFLKFVCLRKIFYSVFF